MSAAGEMLRCEGLGQAFAGREIFSDLSLRLGPGAYALQGANGIGKSTLLAILSGAQTPDSGDIWIDGYNLRAVPTAARRRLSYVPDESPIYPFLSGKELLAFVASAKQCDLGDQIRGHMKHLALEPYLDTRFDAMSLGTQKKFLLLAAWIGAPVALLLDEPSDGLDVSARGYLETLIADTATRSVVLFATHDVDFVAHSNATVIHMETLLEGTRRRVTLSGASTPAEG